jgi:putative ABC transport system substrate-binding protein
VTSRRRLVAGVAGALILAGAPVATRAQARSGIRRIGYLSLQAGPGPLEQEFFAALRNLGYVEGRNLAVVYRWAADQEQRLPALAEQLVHADVELIVTASTPAISAALGATRTIPIVMQSAADPIGSGFVTNLAHPGGNVTGMTLLSTELAAKRLEILRELVPRSKSTSLLAFDNAFATPLLIGAMTSASRQLQLDLVVQLVKTDDDLPRAFAGFEKARAETLVVQTSPFAAARRERIAELAARHRLPAMYEVPAYVDAGGLIAYGPDGPALTRRSAVFVDKILKGAKAGDLPIEQPTKYQLAINLKAAQALGLAIPQSLLLRADSVRRPS